MSTTACGSTTGRVVSLKCGVAPFYVTTMFVRFRERKSGGIQPFGVDAEILCDGGCDRRQDDHRYRCWRKPRCRWHVGVSHGLELEPYRLLVNVIENRRVNGKVRQECIADLGAIDGHFLPGFFAGVAPAIAEKMTGERSWQRASLERRFTFWKNLHETLSRLSNRIDPTTACSIMEAINARIPMPGVEEIEALPLRRAEDGLASAESAQRSSLSVVEDCKKLIAKTEETKRFWDEDAMLQAKEAAAWRAEIDRLKAR